MEYRIALVEDEREYQENMIRLFHQYEKETKNTILIRTFSDGIDILDDYQACFDVILLDIRMKFQDGMTTARKIRKKDENVILVFVTSLAQYAIEGYEVSAMDFLVKPVSYPQLSRLMQRVTQRLEHKGKNKEILVKDGGGKRKINLRQLCYVEVENHNLIFHTTEGDFRQRGMTMSALETELKPFSFVRANQSYLVNLHYVDEIRGDVVLVGTEQLYLSRGRKKEFMQAFADQIAIEG
jgi:DNA-binding LytR/AlgR family response regulator